MAKGDFMKAAGVIPWEEGDELPEDVIRRLRDDECDCDECNAARCNYHLWSRLWKRAAKKWWAEAVEAIENHKYWYEKSENWRVSYIESLAGWRDAQADADRRGELLKDILGWYDDTNDLRWEQLLKRIAEELSDDRN